MTPFRGEVLKHTGHPMAPAPGRSTVAVDTSSRIPAWIRRLVALHLVEWRGSSTPFLG
jgi:hypothetical protein